ncbi:hypothetical protein F7Q91_03565 [Vibrio chagasii]|uniref:Uncharacterized protein n=1 Tax=Vibrio chagasii TaxID=170679 RepID=A0A7V7TIG8_9VIBR|nr:hypothetical protein [Vibrio chagasii]KAB0482501.1 hypothetical protein F7Q91_03565 [Vibrio chagasii]
MLIELKKIRRSGSRTIWETKVLGRDVEVWKKEGEEPQIMDLALSFSMYDSGISLNEFIEPVLKADAGEQLIIPSIPLCVSLNYCERKLNNNLTCMIGLAQRELDSYLMLKIYGKQRIESILKKIHKRIELRNIRSKKVNNHNLDLLYTTRLERRLLSILTRTTEIY